MNSLNTAIGFYGRTQLTVAGNDPYSIFYSPANPRQPTIFCTFITMEGYLFQKYIPEADQRTPFERLLELFLELVTYTSGDVDEALDWMRELGKAHQLTNENYTLEDFIEDLYENGYLRDKDTASGSGGQLTARSEQAMRKRSLDRVFAKMKNGSIGGHRTSMTGQGEELTGDRREFQFGDRTDHIDFTASLHNAQVRGGIDSFSLQEQDLEIHETNLRTSTSTVVMIDISHSMILYGEDRITPAKKVAMALAEFIRTRYPKDTLDFVVFGNEARSITLKQLPYLKVGPYHTNTVAGLQLAMSLLRRRKNTNKQIFMITDGKPTCIKLKDGYFKNSWGLDPMIVNRCLDLASQCRKEHVAITTFMIANDPYLKRFVEDFTEANRGKAIYTGLEGLGEWIFTDYERNRRGNM